MEQKEFFPFEGFDEVEKLRRTELRNAGDFYSKIKNCNVLETVSIMYTCLLRKGMTSSVALKSWDYPLLPKEKKRKLSSFENGMKEIHMESFQDFLKWYNNENVVRTLEALQNMMHFCISIIRKESTC